MSETTDNIRRDAPGLARVAVSSWLRGAEWALETSLRAGRLLLGGGRDGEHEAAAGGETTDERERRDQPETSSEALRRRGADLLRLSADVDFDEDSHPAYARILSDLAPDEARILRLLALEGPQASVDVRGGLPLATRLVAPGLTMIGAAAGCRHPDRVHAYLNNLYRLGLIWFSRESLEDPLAYQVLEAQPEVVESLREAGRTGRTIRRSIHLTAFGEDFCHVCLPLDTAEFTAVVTEQPQTADAPQTEMKMPAGPLSSGESEQAG